MCIYIYTWISQTRLKRKVGLQTRGFHMKPGVFKIPILMRPFMLGLKLMESLMLCLMWMESLMPVPDADGITHVGA